MSEASKIEWTDATWNPVRGCSRVSEGCRNCYAERIAVRMSGPGQWGHGFADVPRRHSETGAATTGVRGKWTGRVELIPSMLGKPLKWRKPRRVFVNSMSDLFHEALRDEQIAHVFGVMAAAPQHTFQILTKRPKRMREWFAWAGQGGDGAGIGRSRIAPVTAQSATAWRDMAWPLPNVWLGTSIEDQATADERVPLLLETPAAKRFVSYEPALGPVDFNDRRDWLTPVVTKPKGSPRLDWIIVGGESSGSGARPFNVGWALDVIVQCKDADVAVFYKQGGSSNRCEHSGKGGCQDCMPAALRVREFPL